MLTPLPPELDTRRQAQLLYWIGWKPVDIAALTGESPQTVSNWKSRDAWDEAPVIKRVEGCVEAKFMQLVLKEPKTGADVRDIDLLGRQIERLARVRRYEQPGGADTDLRPATAAKNTVVHRKPTRNVFTEEQVAKLVATFEERLFGYQRLWRATADLRTRAILKSRQIGATWYFAFEALVDALTTGRNQIFLSASKNQAHVFRAYILQFAAEVGVELVGDPIVLPNGAQLIFLGTNYRTAQGYHGNLYFDEFFWTFGFRELNKVASGMALHKQWRKTYFSTPSSIQHEAYGFWTGADWNRNRTKADRREIDVTWAGLKGGAAAADGVWRQIVTIEDAERLGCNLFDLDALRQEYSPDQFSNLLMCEFIDDSQSVFPLAELKRCMVEAVDAWDDFDFAAQILRRRAYGHRPVWIGYDPAGTGDSAALVVLAPPDGPGGKFRLLERHQFRGMDFLAQAQAIREMCGRYEVTYIGIDATGMGLGVYQLVKQFFPGATQILYSPEVKTRLVLKAKDTISRGRFEMDAGAVDVAQALMSVKKTLTSSGRNVTYEASRDGQGHADLAWALFHAFDHEPLEAAIGGVRRSTLEIS